MSLGKKILQDLKDGKIQIEDLDDADFAQEYHDLRYGERYIVFDIGNILELLNNNICSFRQIVDRIEKVKAFVFDSELEREEQLFEELIKNKLLTQEDLKYLLNKIVNMSEVEKLFYNTPLLKHMLKEFILNKEDITRFNAILKNERSDWCKEKNVRDIFDWIEYPLKHHWSSSENKFVVLELNDENIDQGLVKLIESNRLVYDSNLNEEQRDELIEVVQNNEISRNRLFQIVGNHLESNYDFESLIQYLKKPEKRSIINI